MSIKNTQELRDLLLEVIEKVKNGQLEPRVAGSIVGLSGQIVKSCLLDIAYSKTKNRDKINIGATHLSSEKK